MKESPGACDYPGMLQDRRYQDAIAAHGAAIARLTRAVEADPERQRELVQDIHLQLWRSFATWDGRCSDRSWVFRVAHNVAASHVDRERRQVRTDPTADEARDEVSLADAVERRNALEVVRRQIRELPALDRQVTLLWLEGLAADEIAEVVGGSANAVSVRLHRVKALLAARMKGGTP